ncbi:EthD family reductase [Actinomadura sp. KC216]|uniref:EthD family reductase n=1 Tax=Actinomadura sp. KC216 TaxID=2530370 RepID=UPI00104A5AD9|nr:EthD family reductase [Actinomadura sp. KC216]TDB90635.1 EthD family reductase [Actinomadura sp. KC216]
MPKIIAMFKFRDDKPYEECREHWKTVHSEVVTRSLPECRRYIQNVGVRVRSKAWEYDGVAELWFDDMDAIRRSFEGSRADELRADELNFADMSSSTWMIVNENEVFPGPGTAGTSA